MFASSIITEPVHEPLTIAEVKDHLRIDEDVVVEDALLAGLIKAARVWAENYTQRTFITQTWETRFDHFRREMYLPRSPLQSVSSVSYVTGGSPTLDTVATSVYEVDTYTNPGRVFLGYSQTWPTPQVIQHAVRIRYVAGYGSNGSDVPEQLRLGMLLLIGAWHENREPVVAGVSVSAMPAPVSVEAMFSPYILPMP